jgi:hypothetical protein
VRLETAGARRLGRPDSAPDADAISVSDRRIALLRQLATLPFEELIAARSIEHGSLLKAMENIVVREHAELFRDALEERWSRPRAYRWLRYESHDPIARLIDGTLRLQSEWKASGKQRSAAAESAEARLLDAVEKQFGKTMGPP